MFCTSVCNYAHFDFILCLLYRYGIDLCSALQYLHSKGISHLDVKPANIFLKDNGGCKLGDFGCSRKATSYCDTVAMSTTNATSALTGTVVYRAPELLRGKAPTSKADVYSVGITLWHMLTRETPFAGQDLHAIVFGVVAYNRRPVFPGNDNASNCSWYESLCALCWAGNPQNRPEAAEVVRRLKQHIDGNIDDNAWKELNWTPGIELFYNNSFGLVLADFVLRL